MFLTKKRGFTVIEGVVVVALILVVIGIASMSQKKTEPAVTTPTVTNSVTPSSTTTTPSTPTKKDETADWQTYTNTKYGFSIKYPKADATGNWPRSSKLINDWSTQEQGNPDGSRDGSYSVYFGKEARRAGGDFSIWGINIYSDKKTSVDKLITEQGDQFSDRKVARQDVKLAGKSGFLVTVTTASTPDWISKDVYLISNGYIYQISNGAVDNKLFDTFYNSFTLIK